MKSESRHCRERSEHDFTRTLRGFISQASSESAIEIAARIARRFAMFDYTSHRRGRERDNITHVTVALPACGGVGGGELARGREFTPSFAERSSAKVARARARAVEERRTRTTARWLKKVEPRVGERGARLRAHSRPRCRRTRGRIASVTAQPLNGGVTFNERP